MVSIVVVVVVSVCRSCFPSNLQVSHISIEMISLSHLKRMTKDTNTQTHPSQADRFLFTFARLFTCMIRRKCHVSTERRKNKNLSIAS